MKYVLVETSRRLPSSSNANTAPQPTFYAGSIFSPARGCAIPIGPPPRTRRELRHYSLGVLENVIKKINPRSARPATNAGEFDDLAVAAQEEELDPKFSR